LLVGQGGSGNGREIRNTNNQITNGKTLSG